MNLNNYLNINKRNKIYFDPKGYKELKIKEL